MYMDSVTCPTVLLDDDASECAVYVSRDFLACKRELEDEYY